MLKIFILTFILFEVVINYAVSEFFCGFSGIFCGQSFSDDVNPRANLVILAFANTQDNGTVLVDTAYFPSSEVSQWQNSGKRVLLSIGGQFDNWPAIYTSPTNTNNFVTSLSSIVNQYELDGVDLDI